MTKDEWVALGLVAWLGGLLAWHLAERFADWIMGAWEDGNAQSD